MLARVGRLVRAHPWIVAVAALLMYAGYLHLEVVRAHRKADDAAERAAKAAEKKIDERIKALDQQERAREARVAELARQQQAALARTRQIEDDLGRARAAGQQLERSGSVADVVKFGESLGYHPIPAKRPP
jgi:hypothetical protein